MLFLLIRYGRVRITRCGGSKIDSIPLTAPTPGSNWLKFFMEASQEDTFGGTGVIFKFHARSRDTEILRYCAFPRLRPFYATPRF